MARIVRNDCVGCGLPCIHCGRERDYVVYECDLCGLDNCDGEVKIFDDGEGHHLCATCLLRKHMLDFATDMAEEYGLTWLEENYDEVWSEE